MRTFTILLHLAMSINLMSICPLKAVGVEVVLPILPCNNVQFPVFNLEDSINNSIGETTMENEVPTPLGPMHLVTTFPDTVLRISNSDIIEYTQIDDTVFVKLCAVGVRVDFDVEISIPLIFYSTETHGQLSYDSIKGSATYLVGCDGSLTLSELQYLNFYGEDVNFTGGSLSSSILDLTSQLYLSSLHDIIDDLVLQNLSSIQVEIGPVPEVEISGNHQFCIGDINTFSWGGDAGMCDIVWEYSGAGEIVGDSSSSMVSIDFTGDEIGGELILKVRALCDTVCDTLFLSPYSINFCALPFCDGDSIFISDQFVLMDPDTINASSVVEIDRALMNGSSLHLYANERILIQPYFSAGIGTVFTADIKNCRPGSDVLVKNNEFHLSKVNREK